MKANDLEHVVQQIYEASARPELWRETLNTMAVRCGAKGVQMLHHRPEGASLHAASEGLDEVLEAFFAEGWHRNNPREVRARQRGNGPLDVLTDRDLFTPEELDQEPWQRDFLDRFGLRWFASLPLRRLIEMAPFFLSIERLKTADPFGTEDVAGLTAIVPHIQRAIAMSVAFGAGAQSGMMDTFSALRQAAILLDDLGRVTQMNESAVALEGRGFVVSQGRIRATDRKADGPFQNLIGSVCWPGAAISAPALDAVPLPRAGRRPLIVQAAPLVNSARDLFQLARAVLLFKDLEPDHYPNEALLQGLFGLTTAEARLAGRLASGGGLVGAADSLGISPNTARTHLKAIFAKTGTRNQSELAVLLARSSQPLAFGSPSFV